MFTYQDSGIGISIIDATGNDVAWLQGDDAATLRAEIATLDALVYPFGPFATRAEHVSVLLDAYAPVAPVAPRMTLSDTLAVADVTRNLWHWFNVATPEQYSDGRAWYATAHDIAADIAVATGIDVYNVAGVIAALSPNNPWNRNIVDAVAVCRAVADGRGEDSVRVCTYNANKRRAFAIARGDSVNSGRKTRSFVHNIAYPRSSLVVTVDIWMIRAALNNPAYGLSSSETVSLSDGWYTRISDVIIDIAAQNDLLPCQVQAIIWTVIRR